MRRHKEFEEFIAELKRALRMDPVLARRVEEETRDHLDESARAGEARGLSPAEARAQAVASMGPPKLIASHYPRLAWMSRALLLGAAVFSLLISAWLVTVLVFVLPVRNPAQIPFWTVVCGGFLAYGTLTCLFLTGLARSGTLRWGLVGVSLLCIPPGLYAVASQIRRAADGGEFEGYLLLMGAALAAHGALFTIHALLTRRDSGRLPD